MWVFEKHISNKCVCSCIPWTPIFITNICVPVCSERYEIFKKEKFKCCKILNHGSFKIFRDQRILDPRDREFWIRRKTFQIRIWQNIFQIRIRDPNLHGARTFVAKSDKIRNLGWKCRDSKIEFEVNFLDLEISKKFFKLTSRYARSFEFWRKKMQVLKSKSEENFPDLSPRSSRISDSQIRNPFWTNTCWSLKILVINVGVRLHTLQTLVINVGVQWLNILVINVGVLGSKITHIHY